MFASWGSGRDPNCPVRLQSDGPLAVGPALVPGSTHQLGCGKPRMACPSSRVPMSLVVWLRSEIKGAAPDTGTGRLETSPVSTHRVHGAQGGEVPPSGGRGRAHKPGTSIVAVRSRKRDPVDTGGEKMRDYSRRDGMAEQTSSSSTGGCTQPSSATAFARIDGITIWR